jgi:hypothetical protein
MSLFLPLPAAKEHTVLNIESIICFESTAQAIMAEQALLQDAFYVRVMPKPSVIEAGCGFCLRFLPDDIDKAVSFLAKQGLNVKEIYHIEESGGTVSYTRQTVMNILAAEAQKH